VADQAAGVTGATTGEPASLGEGLPICAPSPKDSVNGKSGASAFVIEEP
jgi:hypothetical protein